MELERFASLLRAIRDAVIRLDAAGEIIEVNVACERLLGWRSEDLQGKNIRGVFTPYQLEGKKPLPEQFETVFDRGLSWQSDEYVVVKTRLEIDCFVTFKMVPIFGPDSKVVGAYLILENKNERVRLETEMLKTQKMESIGFLAGGLAHDFNNLLTAIVGNLSMMKALSGGDAAIAPQISAAERATDRAKNLAQKLLGVCKTDKAVRENVDLAGLLTESCTLMTSGTQCSVSFELPDEGLNISADEDQISQVINNLVLNAIQALGGKGEVLVSAKYEKVGTHLAESLEIDPGEYVEIAVRDNGPGIPESLISKIFSPFFTTKEEGNGLGLASCRTILKRHGGALSVDSEIGLGATFTCFIPVAAKVFNEPDRPVATAPKKAVQSGKGMVLVMDDESMIRQIAGDMLEILGYHAGLAEDGETMLQMYESALKDGVKYDVVLMDLTIPGGMGGKEALEKLLELDPNACAVVSSGYSNDPIMEDPEAFGFTAAIQKPYTVQDLSSSMKELIAGS